MTETRLPPDTGRRNRVTAIVLLLWFALAFWFAATRFRIPGFP